MEWRDTGLVLASRRHGERDAILEVMSENHGRHLGLVRSGRSSKQAPGLQPGNRVALVWRARLEEHLGQFVAEVLESRAAYILADPLALHAVAHLGLLLRLLPERDPHPEVFAAADGIAALAMAPLGIAEALARFELMMLAELGFGLDLSECAATGTAEDLAFVSPKSGRAVSRAAGEPWAAKLLPLPAFVITDEAPENRPSPAELLAAFRLSGFFLERHVFSARGVTQLQARDAFMALLAARTALLRSN